MGLLPEVESQLQIDSSMQGESDSEQPAAEAR